MGELALVGKQGEERQELAQVTEEAVLCKVETSRFLEMMHAIPELNFVVTKLIGLCIRKVQTKLENLIFKTYEERVLWFLKKNFQLWG